MVYRGKGFENIARIRQLLPEDIQIRVAGRGTELLPRMDGVEILGGVEGSDEDAFFESVRAIVVPYGKRHFYAETYPASGVGAHAQAYRTPIISTGYGPLSELDESCGAVTIKGDGAGSGDVVERLTEAIVALIGDHERLTQLGDNADGTRLERSAAATGQAFAEAWSRMLFS